MSSKGSQGSKISMVEYPRPLPVASLSSAQGYCSMPSLLVSLWFWQPPPVPLQAPLTVSAQIIIKLLDQLPNILSGLAILLPSIIGILNYRRIGAVKDQTDGHLSTLTKKNEELHTEVTSIAKALATSSNALANSVPTATLVTAVAAAAGQQQSAAQSAADRATERATDRAADRASDRATDRLGDRRAAVPIKVEVVGVAPSVLIPAAPQVPPAAPAPATDLPLGPTIPSVSTKEP